MTTTDTRTAAEIEFDLNPQKFCVNPVCCNEIPVSSRRDYCSNRCKQRCYRVRRRGDETMQRLKAFTQVYLRKGQTILTARDLLYIASYMGSFSADAQIAAAKLVAAVRVYTLSEYNNPLDTIHNN